MPGLDLLAGVAELTGLWLLGNKQKWGFIFNLIASVCWFYVAFHNEVYGLLIIAVPALFINTRNFIKWHKDKDITAYDKAAGIG